MIKPTLHFQRFEFKYYLPQSTADKLIPALMRHMDWDPYIKSAGLDYYQVNSLYFDSPDYGCFWDKESGISYRKKLRFRFYGDWQAADPVFLEIKRKRDALVIKDRVSFRREDLKTRSLNTLLFALAGAGGDDQFLRELVWFKNRNNLEPKLFVAYRRKALVGKADNRFRVTFDYAISAQKCEELGALDPADLEEVYSGGVVLELKYNNVLPFWFQEIIQQYQLQVLAYSKYCNALRIIEPRFDDNNYILPKFQSINYITNHYDE